MNYVDQDENTQNSYYFLQQLTMQLKAKPEKKIVVLCIEQFHIFAGFIKSIIKFVAVLF